MLPIREEMPSALWIHRFDNFFESVDIPARAGVPLRRYARGTVVFGHEIALTF